LAGKLIVRGAIDVIEYRARQSPFGKLSKIMEIVTLIQAHMFFGNFKSQRFRIPRQKENRYSPAHMCPDFRIVPRFFALPFIAEPLSEKTQLESKSVQSV
jgi:hypothetical protein